MDIFKTVKANITARQAAEHYGLQVRVNGMACCPFHPDKHPSMKLDERYYCFGCRGGAPRFAESSRRQSRSDQLCQGQSCLSTGDVIDFVANLHGIGKLDAARRLAEDFHLEYGKPAPHSRGKPPPTPEQRREWLMQKTRHAFMVWRDNAISTLYAYGRFLEEQKESYAPVTRDAEWCKLFIAALREKDTVALYLHILQEEPLENQVSLFNQSKERIEEFGKQMEQHRRTDDGRAGAGARAG